jgi:hypothetical protein
MVNVIHSVQSCLEFGFVPNIYTPEFCSRIEEAKIAAMKIVKGQDAQTAIKKLPNQASSYKSRCTGNGNHQLEDRHLGGEPLWYVVNLRCPAVFENQKFLAFPGQQVRVKNVASRSEKFRHISVGQAALPNSEP